MSDPDGEQGPASSLTRPGAVLRALWMMARPAQLALIALVYALGVAIAAAHGAPPDGRSVLVGFGVLLPVAASVHYANEYADYETDALADRTPFSGGSGAFVETGVPRRIGLAATVAAGTVGLAALSAAVVVGPALGSPVLISPPAAALAVGILLVGWAYSLEPVRLVRRGLGEVTNAALGGLALPAYGYAVVAGTVTTAAVLATVPFALVVFVNLLETTWPDRDPDAAVGKRTLVTRWSTRRARVAYTAVSALAALSLVALAGSVLPWPIALASLVPTAGLAPGAVRFTRAETPLPAVLSMVALAAVQTAGWAAVARGLG